MATGHMFILKMYGGQEEPDKFPYFIIKLKITIMKSIKTIRD